MALGRFADENLALNAAFSGGVWSAAHPLANLTADGYIARPARCENPSNLAHSRFDATLQWPRALSLIGVLFHTLSSQARYRLTVAGVGGTLADPVYQSPWTPVVGRLWDSQMLDWESANWWTGQPVEDELDLYPRHLWIPVTPVLIASAIRLEFDDAEAAYFDLGGLFITSGFSPTFNFDRGRSISADSRDLIEEGPSGRLFSDPRRPRRKVTVAWSNLTTAEAYRWLDAGMRAGSSRTVLFVPDLDDPVGMVREAFPATFEKLPAPKIAYERLQSVEAVTFKEIIA